MILKTTEDRGQKTDETTFNQKFLRMFHGQGRFFQKEPLVAEGKKKEDTANDDGE